MTMCNHNAYDFYYNFTFDIKLKGLWTSEVVGWFQLKLISDIVYLTCTINNDRRQ